MKRDWKRISIMTLMSAVVFVLMLMATTSTAIAGRGNGGGGGGGDDDCPRTGIVCTMEYNPVLCDDGNVYGNPCVAYVNCAEGCEPIGPGPIPLP